MLKDNQQMTDKIQKLTHENTTYAKELETSGRGDLFFLYSEVKSQLEVQTLKNENLLAENTRLQPYVQELKQEKQINNEVNKDLNSKVRENMKLKREIDDLKHKLRSAEKQYKNALYQQQKLEDRELEKSAREQSRSAKTSDFKFDWYDPVIGSTSGTSVFSAKKDRAESVYSYKSYRSTSFRDRENSNTNSFFQTTNNNTFVNLNSANTKPVLMSNSQNSDNSTPQDSPVKTYKLKIHHSQDDKTREKLSNLLNKINHKFGAKIVTSLHKVDEDFDEVNEGETSFEIYLDEVLIFSKLTAGNFPQDLKILDKIAEKVE